MLDPNLHQANRRDLLKAGLVAGSGFVIACSLPLGLGKMAFAAGVSPNLDYASSALPNAFIQIGSDNSVTLSIHKLEMGQGIHTSLAQLIAEELGCDWQVIRCVAAPVAPVYNATFMPMQMAGGSSSISSSWDQLRTVGAMAREMLIAAAAKRWNVAPASCKAAAGMVTHVQKGSLSYGELADAAAKEVPPTGIKLKDPKTFTVIGKAVPRVDAAAKSNGSAIYGLDVKVPGMLYAVIARPPFGATLDSYDEQAARKFPGVKDVRRMGDKVAFVATNTWSAQQAREAAKVSWKLSDAPTLSQKTLMSSLHQSLDQAGTRVKSAGRVDAALSKAHKTIEASYEFPYLAHACMEPMNCTVAYDGTKAQIWAGHQMPGGDRLAAASVLELPPESIEVTTTYAGGSFGRRANKNSDFVVEAAMLAKQLKQAIKVVWTREDDMRGGYYRPLTLHKVKAGVNKSGRPSGWKHTIVGQGVMIGSPFGGAIEKSGIDPTSIEGVADSPYAPADFQLDLHMPKLEVTTLWWRSVGHTHTAYVMETMIDELAEAAGKDALQYRRELLKKNPRHLAVLDLLAKESAWGKKMPPGHALGLAVHQSFNSVVGHVVELSLKGSEPVIHRIVSAVHCGTVVNPQGARAQIESAVVYGLSACLYGELTLDRGQVQQSNFHDYPVLRLSAMPPMEIHFVPSQEAPTGLGEPGLPPLAPAVANALYKLKGQRFRSLPLGKHLS